jgi:hypothetical protein
MMPLDDNPSYYVHNPFDHIDAFLPAPRLKYQCMVGGCASRFFIRRWLDPGNFITIPKALDRQSREASDDMDAASSISRRGGLHPARPESYITSSRRRQQAIKV